MALANLRPFWASNSMSQAKGPSSTTPDMVFAVNDHSPWSR